MYAVGDLVNVHACRSMSDAYGDKWHLIVDHGVVMKVDGDWVSLWCPNFHDRQNMNPHFTERFRNAKRVRITPTGKISEKHINAMRNAGHAPLQA